MQMKKKLVALLAGALLALGMAGNAMAYFSGDDLIRVVYNTSTNVEAVTDLGSIESLTGTTNNVVGGGANSFMSVSGLSGSNLANDNVAYFAISTTYNGNTGKYLWASGSTTTASGITPSKWASSGAALQQLIGQWNVNGNNSQTYIGNTTATPSYFVTANKTGTSIGSLDGFMNAASIPNTEANLATLASTAVQQGLWYFGTANKTTAAGVQQLELQTNADGSTTINPGSATPTPIPPAFFLMGSGLLGMFGLRRKRA